MRRKVKPIHAFEYLANIEAAKDDEKIKLLKEYGSKYPLNMLLSLNFNHNVVLDLPEGMPEMNLRDMDVHTHPDFQGLLGNAIQKLKYCLVSCKTVDRKKKERIFYDVLINSPMKDAEILCAAKDHALEELYPSITVDLVKKVFPQYVNIPKEVGNDPGKTV